MCCRPKSHPLSDRMGRFADPLHDKNKTVPGPGYYSPDSILTMGQDSMCVPQRGGVTQ